MENNISWREKAACRGMDTNFFFPKLGVNAKQVREIKAICASCPVTVQCLDIALEQDIDNHGFFGGTSPNERRLIRSQARSARNKITFTSAVYDYESTQALDLECQNQKIMA